MKTRVSLLQVDLRAELPGGWRATLSPEEVWKAEGMPSAMRKQEFVACRAALREYLAAQLGLEATRVPIVLDPLGKPRLLAPNGPHFSISHSGDIGLIAVCDSAPLGVDIEELRGFPEVSELGGGSLREFFESWTRMEAIAKATGLGLLGADQADERASAMKLVRLETAEGYTGYLAVTAPGEVDLSLCVL